MSTHVSVRTDGVVKKTPLTETYENKGKSPESPREDRGTRGESYPAEDEEEPRLNPGTGQA